MIAAVGIVIFLLVIVILEKYVEKPADPGYVDRYNDLD